MLSNEKLEEMAKLQLQLAVVKGERWALEAVLGIKRDVNLNLGGGGEDNKRNWTIKVVNVETSSKEKSGDNNGDTETPPGGSKEQGPETGSA